MGVNALVVGRNPALCRAIRDALDCFIPNAEVTIVATSRECLAGVDIDHFDFILADIDLPDTNCASLVTTLRLAQPSIRIFVTMDSEHVDGVTAADLRRRGADSVVPRPTPRSAVQFLEAIRGSLKKSRANRMMKRTIHKRPNRLTPSDALPVRRVTPRPAPRGGSPTDFWITAIAISTGGPAALSTMVPKLPADYPHPILVVQHMPRIFTTSLAKDLNSRSAVTVVEAAAGEILKAGTVYIAPGDLHMAVKRQGSSTRITLNEDPPENGCRPSADVMYRSLAKIQDAKGVLAVVMTGLGVDGCEGVRILKSGSCYCVSQEAESCTVYGMPRAVDDCGLSDESIPLMQLHERLIQLAHGRALART